MSLFRVRGTEIKGIGAAVPHTAVYNRDYELISQADRELLIRTTGIESRYIALDGQTTGDLCYAAADKLINELAWNRSEIDLLIFVSQSPDHFLPATSIILQDRLGLPKTTAAFDIMLGCSGYVYGLSVAASMMATGGFRRALLLAGDVSSAGVNVKDKSTYPLFGDCGTATALEYNRDYEMFFNLQSDGAGKDAIIIPDGGLRHPIDGESLIEKEYETGVIRHRRNLWLNGFDVFNFSVREGPPNITELLSHFNLNAEETDLLIMHQANFLMNETIRKKLKYPAEKTPYTLKNFGNTSSASIPLTLNQALNGKSDGRKLLLASFGVGFSWGSCYLQSGSMICPAVSQI